MSREIRANAKKKLYKFLEKIGVKYPGEEGWSILDCNTEDHLPCFAHRVHTTPYIKTVDQAREFIDIALEAKTGDIECICISVTDRDYEKQAFLDVAKEDGHTVVGPVASIHGKYDAYAIFCIRKHAAETVRHYR